MICFFRNEWKNRTEEKQMTCFCVVIVVVFIWEIFSFIAGKFVEIVENCWWKNIPFYEDYFQHIFEKRFHLIDWKDFNENSKNNSIYSKNINLIFLVISNNSNDWLKMILFWKIDLFSMRESFSRMHQDINIDMELNTFIVV